MSCFRGTIVQRLSSQQLEKHHTDMYFLKWMAEKGIEYKFDVLYELYIHLCIPYNSVLFCRHQLVLLHRGLTVISVPYIQNMNML